MNPKLCDWMHRFGNEFKDFADIPLNSLYLPGSHDSGAYVFYTENGFAPDRPDLIEGTFLSLLANLFPCIARPFVARFSKTQVVDVLTQLELGIRYLDLRVAFDDEDKKMKICHNLYADQLQIVLDDVHRFAQKFHQEVIILDFQHFYNFDNENHFKLMKHLANIFEGRLIPAQTTAKFSLNDIWNKYSTERIIIVYRNNFMIQKHKDISYLFWDSDSLPNPWPNTRNSEKLKDHIRMVIPARPATKLFVTQAVLTPNTKYSLLHFCSSLKPLADSANRIVRSMIKDGEFEQAKIIPGSGPNIIMTDFVSPSFVEEIVQLNLTQKSL